MGVDPDMDLANYDTATNALAQVEKPGDNATCALHINGETHRKTHKDVEGQNNRNRVHPGLRKTRDARVVHNTKTEEHIREQQVNQPHAMRKRTMRRARANVAARLSPKTHQIHAWSTHCTSGIAASGRP